MEYDLICKQCGYTREPLHDGYEDYECPICNGLLQQKHIIETDKKMKKVKLEKIVDKFILRSMEENIKKLGNDRTWYILEKVFFQPKVRLAYRKIFFRADGITPLSEVKI